MTMWRMPCRAFPPARRFALACFVFFGAMFASVAAASYRIVELPVPSDSLGGDASDINAAGDVVGHVFDVHKGRHRATVWRAPDHVPRILSDDPVTYRDSEANRINDRGSILGELHPRKAGAPWEIAVWGPGDSVVLLARVQGQQWSTAYDINDRNVVVGTVMPHNGTAGAVVWLSPQDVRWLAGNNPSFRQGEAHAINDAGVIVGFGHAQGSYPAAAFRWTRGEGMQALPGGQSIAYDINDAGQAVGWSGSNAVLWEADGRMHSLGGLPGGGASDLQANRINNLGVVIGQTQGSGEITDFVWTSGSGIVRIADAIDPADPWYAPLRSGDARLSVRGLNDAGTIVGVLYLSDRLYGIPVMLVPQPECPLSTVCRGPTVVDTAGRIGTRR
jgi:uncharacterized membrane protein